MTDKECIKCIHKCVCKTAESCDGFVSGCKHFKEQKKGRMDMKEKLVELIENAESQRLSVALCCTTDELIDLPSKEEYIADYLIANGVTVQKWISVKDIDRLPTENKRVLVYGYRSGEIFKARRRGNKWYSSWDNVTEIECVSHWCYLPQPPKGE